MFTTTRLCAAVAATVLLLAACGGSDDDAGPEASAPGSSVEATVQSTDTTALETSETTEAESSAGSTTDPTTSAAPATSAVVTSTSAPTTTAPPDDGSCLVGNWIVTQDQMNLYYSGLMSTLDAPLDISVVGSAPLDFHADGTYAWAPAFDLTVAVAGQSGVGATSGSITGDWMAAAGMVTTASDVNALDVTVTIGSTTISGSDMANGLLNTSPVNGVTYSCDGPTPVLDFKTADPAVTVPVTLAAA